MATNQSFACSYGTGRARYLAGLPFNNDALVLLLLQAGHEDDKLLWRRETFASLLAVAANKEITAAGWTRPVITSGTTESVDNASFRVDVDIPDQQIGEIGAIDGANARQDIRALIIGYQFDRATANNSSTYILSKHYFPFIADGSARSIPFPNGFYRAAPPAVIL